MFCERHWRLRASLRVPPRLISADATLALCGISGPRNLAICLVIPVPFDPLQRERLDGCCSRPMGLVDFKKGIVSILLLHLQFRQLEFWRCTWCSLDSIPLGDRSIFGDSRVGRSVFHQFGGGTLGGGTSSEKMFPIVVATHLPLA